MPVFARPSPWVLVALTATLCACGESTDRFSLRTPGTKTGDPESAVTLVIPTATPKAKKAAKPKAKAKPVTAEERRVIKGWSDELRHGHVQAASRYFTIPSVVSNQPGAADTLGSRADVTAFNATLACGARLVKTRRSAKGFVVGTFTLTQRPGADCGTGVGGLAEVAFLIRHHRINQWVRLDDPPQANASPTATPTPTATPDSSTGTA